MSPKFVGTVEFSPALQCCFQRFVVTVAVTVNNIKEGKEGQRNENLGFLESVPTIKIMALIFVGEMWRRVDCAYCQERSSHASHIYGLLLK